MNFSFIAGVFCLCGTLALGASTVDDNVKAFEAALKTSPLTKNDSSAGVSFQGRPAIPQDLDAAMEQGADERIIEDVVARLMSTHSSAEVQQAGGELIDLLEAQRKARVTAFIAKVNALLAEASDAVTHAKKASDLDGILKELQAPADAPGRDSSPATAAKLNATFQFVALWQDYLSATERGNTEEARSRLRQILDNRQIDARAFFPRSEILARMEDGGGTVETGGIDDINSIIAKVKSLDDVQDALGKVSRITPPNYSAPWDWSALQALEKARLDAVAGLTTSVDLKSVMHGAVWGDDIDRIVAMELHVLLPYYLGTEATDAPKADETIDAYLNRLGTKAYADGNLALLQRTISVRIALADQPESPSSLGTREFLAGLSQDAAGQFAPAVTSYENALKQPDPFLPIKIVADRLAVIKAAHPDDFEKGLTAFLTPTPIMRPGMPPWMQPGMPGFPYGNPPTSVLPIPMSISLPPRATASPTNPAPQPSPP